MKFDYVMIYFLFMLVCTVFSVVSAKVKKQKEAQQAQQRAEQAQQRAKQAAAQGQTPREAVPARPEAVPAPAPAESRVLQPTIRVTEGDDSIYAGSMNAVTTEGYDPCHEDILRPRETVPAPAAPAAPRPGFTLNWTGGEIVKGLVISEILNRKQR